MYLISRTRDFDRSYKRIEQSGKLKDQTKKSLEKIINTLASGQKLTPTHKDHQLKGDLQDYRECHIKGDLLLVYQIRKERLVLILMDIGTHSYLGL